MSEKRESYTTTEMEEALNHYVEYLNRWWNHSEPNEANSPFRYETFTIWDPNRNLYGTTKEIEDYKVSSQDAETERILLMMVHDGDEGGPAELVVGFDHEGMSWIIQVFDTMPAFIWSQEDGYRSPPNGEMKP